MTTELRKSRYPFWALVNMIVGMFVCLMTIFGVSNTPDMGWGWFGAVVAGAYTATCSIMFPLTQMQVDLEKSGRYEKRISELLNYAKFCNQKIERLEQDK
jgi:hypothetical protein